MRKRQVSEIKAKKDFDLLDYKRDIVAAFLDGEKTVELDGRKFNLALQNLSNVDYVIVTPEKGLTPCGNFILSDTQHRKEMERRETPLPDRKPLRKS